VRLNAGEDVTGFHLACLGLCGGAALQTIITEDRNELDSHRCTVAQGMAKSSTEFGGKLLLIFLGGHQVFLLDPIRHRSSPITL